MAVRHQKKNGEVKLAREEYDALIAREERYAELLSENEKLATRVNDLISTCDSQARRMNETDLKTQHLERQTGLQQMLIEMLRGDGVASLQELSEFWRRWTVHVRKLVDEKKLNEADVATFEPDLFRAWRHWIKEAGKSGRTILDSGTMTRLDSGAPKTAAEMQEHLIRRLNEDNAKLAAKNAQLEQQLAEQAAKAQATKVPS